MNNKFNLKKELVIGFILGGIICAVISAAINYYLIKMPDSGSVNAINHGVSGLMSGGISAIIATVITYKKLSK